MPRIQALNKDSLPPSVSIVLERHLQQHNANVTNTSLTLCHSLLALEVYLHWHTLYARLEELLGKRMAAIYAYALSKSSDSPLCTAFFRKILAENFEDPDGWKLDEQEKAIYDFGTSVSLYKGNISDHVFHPIERYFDSESLVLLIAFAGQMIAINVFNNVVETDIDSYLANYVREAKYYRQISSQ